MLSRKLLYVRYADDFLLGIVGPKLFAVEITNRIKVFIWGNLQLNIKGSKIINRNEAGVIFLGFILYLPQFRKKATVKRSEIQSIKKCVARSKARVAAGLAGNSKAFFYALKRDIILSLAQHSLNSGSSDSKLENLIENKFTLQSKSLNYSEKRKDEIANHFRSLFSKNFSFLALRAFNENFKPFVVDKEFKTTKIAVELNSLVEDFLNNLKKIEVEVKEN